MSSGSRISLSSLRVSFIFFKFATSTPAFFMCVVKEAPRPGSLLLRKASRSDIKKFLPIFGSVANDVVGFAFKFIVATVVSSLSHIAIACF